MKKYKVIAIMGKSGSGKDTLLKKVTAARPQLHELISYTSRPIRENETNGINYYYITEQDFKQKIDNNEMLEYTCFNDWFYGTAYDKVDINNINIGVFSPEGVRSLMSHNDIELTVYYLRAADNIRLIRQLSREEHPNVDEIIRRYWTDNKDFEFLNDIQYIELQNNNISDLTIALNMVLDKIN